MSCSRAEGIPEIEAAATACGGIEALRLLSTQAPEDAVLQGFALQKVHLIKHNAHFNLAMTTY